jgi:predicted kinase
VFDPVPLATAAGLAKFWASSLTDMQPLVGTLFDSDEFDEVRGLATEYLDHHDDLFDRRRRDGFVRDGHGDLIADDIFVLPDGPRILDCLAFDDVYRVSDVLADIAFLVMDVERLAGREPARHLMQSYCRYTGEHHPSSLAHHYVAYRAHVRAKVAALRWSDGDRDSALLARTHHAQACDHLRRARSTVVLLGGGPGTGKTTLAAELGERMGWLTIDSDTIRKDLRRIDHDDHRVDQHPELYDEATTEATYAELIDRGASVLHAGDSVILDATWARHAHRERARAAALAAGARLIEIECLLDADVARRRIADRRRSESDVSDATPGLVGAVRDPWHAATRVDTAGPVQSVCEGLIARLEPEGVRP